MPLTRFLLCVVVIAAVAAAAAGQSPQYIVINLGVVPTGGGTGVEAYGVNNAGQIVGRVGTGANTADHFVWSAGSVIARIQTASGATPNPAINNAGRVVGYGYNGTNAYAYQYTIGSGTLTTLAGYNGVTRATDINDSGVISGIGTFGGNVGILYANAAATPVQIAGANTRGGLYINNAGLLAGTSSSSPGVTQAFIQAGAGGSRTYLGTLGGAYSEATAINDAGQVVGYSTASGVAHAFLYSNGVMIDLGVRPGSGQNGSRATAVNNFGVAVGDENAANGQALLFKDGTVQSLNSLITPDSEWNLTNAFGINDNGWIVGTGTFNGQQAAFPAHTGAGAGGRPGDGRRDRAGRRLVPPPVGDATIAAGIVAHRDARGVTTAVVPRLTDR